MERDELLKSPNYWLAYIQNGLYTMLQQYKSKNKLKDKDIAQKLGVTKGYVSQILNGDFDHKISKLIELSLACGKIPNVSYLDLEKYINDDAENRLYDDNPNLRPVQYLLSVNSGDTFIVNKESIESLEKLVSNHIPNEVHVQSESIAFNMPNYYF